MVDVRETYAQQIDAARVALSRGDKPAAAASFRAAIEAARGNPDLERELVPPLVHLGKLEQELGHPAEAERVLDEALAIGERVFGTAHPSLGVVLNELGRLHIRQSNHARAAAVLARLLRITRAKGEEHADVATALAGLAVARRGLGDHSTAEQHYRDALRIREKVLAPNHMAIVVTMEQLAETCASRGNPAEALALLNRALPRREAALGADHATVRAVKSRIAALAPQAVAPAPDPAPRTGPNDLVFIYEPQPAAPRNAPLTRERVAPPTYSAAVSAPPRVSSPIQMAARSAVAHDDAARDEAPHHVAANHEVARHEVASAPVARVEHQRGLGPLSADSHERVPHKRSTLYLSAALAVALVGAMLTSRSSAGPGSDAAARADAEQSASASMADGANTLGAASDSVGAVSTTSQSLALMARGDTRMTDSVTVPALPSVPVAPRRLAKMKVPIITTSNVDSLVRASTKAGLASDQIGMADGLRMSPISDDTSGTHPVLIGRAPLPYFPDALRSQRTEGEVVVRFRVDERGLVDASSMKVLKSDHMLFTLAVRNVLPRFRFEPARSPAPESKPRSEWVDFRTEFTAKNN